MQFAANLLIKWRYNESHLISAEKNLVYCLWISRAPVNLLKVVIDEIFEELI